MSRIRSFAAPHKGLRNVIAQFSLKLGSIDFKNTFELAALKELGNEMFTLLNDHVHTENEHTLKNLEQRAPGTSQHDREDHERLEAVQDSLQHQLLQFTGNEDDQEVHLFYLNFSRFHSQYLEHIYEEETVTELLLQQYFTDEELMQHRIRIMQRVQFPMLLLWMKYIIPAQAESESVGMLKGMKANAPKEAFDQVASVIKSEMSDTRFDQLMRKLEAE
jgi:hypothetical protein